MKELDVRQRDRIVEAVKLALDPVTLENFTSLWPRNQKAALKSLNLDEEDFDDFVEYLQMFGVSVDPFQGPKPQMVPW